MSPPYGHGLRWAVASIHERPIFWSLATNLGTTFKAPTNLGALALGLKLFLGKSMMQCHLKFLEASRAACEAPFVYPTCTPFGVLGVQT